MWHIAKDTISIQHLSTYRSWGKRKKAIQLSLDVSAFNRFCDVLELLIKLSLKTPVQWMLVLP